MGSIDRTKKCNWGKEKKDRNNFWGNLIGIEREKERREIREK